MKRKAICGMASLLLLPVLSGCGPSRKDTAIYVKDQQIRALKAQNAEKERLLAEERAEKAKLVAGNEAWRKNNAELTKRQAEKFNALCRQVAALNEQLAKAERPSVNKTTTTTNNMTVVSEHKGIVLTLAGTMLFDSGRATLKKRARSMLKQLAETIKSKYPDKYLRIEGHTDSTPIRYSKWKTNMKLSIARAEAVYNYLVKNCGLQPNRMYTAGFGSKQPLVWPEKTRADRARNRRVDIVILPKVPVEKRELSSTK